LPRLQTTPINVFKAKTSNVEALLLTVDNKFYMCDKQHLIKMTQPPQKIHDFAFFEDKILFEAVKGVWAMFKVSSNPCLQTTQEIQQLSFDTEKNNIFVDFVEKGFAVYEVDVKGISDFAVVGIVVGVIGVGVIVGIAVFYKMKHKKKDELYIQIDNDETTK
jgi:hypothetical protein